MPYYSQEILHKKTDGRTDFGSNFLKFCVERFFPFGGAGLASIFRFLPNLEALGARSLSSKLIIGRDSQSLEVVEELQAPERPIAATATNSNKMTVGHFFLLQVHYT